MMKRQTLAHDADLELIVVVLAISVALGVLLTPVELLGFKARFTELLGRVQMLQMDSVERFAVTGSWLESGAAITDQTDGGQHRELERELAADVATVSPIRAPGAVSKKARDETALEGGSSSRYASVRSGIVEGNIVLVGKLPGYARPFHLAVQPAVQAGEEPAAVIWLCGRRTAGAGWVASGPPVRSGLPDEFLISQCRGERRS
jgi:hypothetical protein